LTNEEYCIECGDVVEENTEEDYWRHSFYDNMH
jgi:hypothetical protein